MIKYMVIPMDLNEEQEHIYKKLYKKCDLDSMMVDYTVQQLVVDSNSIFNLTTQKIRTILKFLIAKGYLIEVQKGFKGNPSVYRIVKIVELNQQQSNNNLTTNQQLINSNLTINQQQSNSNDVVIEPVVEVEQQQSNNKSTVNQQQSNNNLTTNQQIINNPIKDKDKDNDNDKINNIWSMYPKKEGKAAAIKKIPKIIKEIGEEHLIRCIERYNKKIEVENISKQYIKQGSTFFNGGYVDYLDENYQDIKEGANNYGINKYNKSDSCESIREKYNNIDWDNVGVPKPGEVITTSDDFEYDF